MKAYIKAITYYIPEKILTNQELLSNFPEWSVEKVANKLGISERHIANDNESSSDMAVKAALKLFGEYKVDPGSIDYILFCTQSPDYFLPTSACIIQDRLSIPSTAGAIDFNLGCSGYVYGLSLAKGLLAANIANNVLLLTAETYTKYIHPKDKSNRSIFGDAASATLISSDGYGEIMNFDLGTDGRGAKNLIVKTGGSRNPSPIFDINFDENGNPVSSDHLFMDGPSIFSFSLDVVPISLYRVLEKNNMFISDIDLFIFHQANKYLLNFVRKKVQIPEDKFYLFIEKVGNTVSSTIPIALKEARSEEKLKGNILLSGFGVGYSWGSTILVVN